MGNFPCFPGKPPASANAATSWRKTASDCPYLLEVFLRVQGRELGGKPTSALWTGGQGDAVPFGPEAQERPSFSDSFLRLAHAPLPNRPLMSPEQPGFFLSAQGAGDICLTSGPLFLPGPALQLRDRFPTTRPRAPSLLLGQRASLSQDRLLWSPVTDMSLSLRFFPQAQPRFSLTQRGCPGNEDFAPCGFITPCCRVLLTQAAAASHRPDSDFPKNAVFSQSGCPGKEAFTL